MFICIDFASLKYLWDVQNRSLLNCSTSHMVPHTFWFLYMHTDRVVPRTMKQSTNISLWDHRSPASPRLGDWQWIFITRVSEVIMFSPCVFVTLFKSLSRCLSGRFNYEGLVPHKQYFAGTLLGMSSCASYVSRTMTSLGHKVGQILKVIYLRQYLS